MALVRCRRCSRTVLSAASQCPHCLQPMDPDQRDEIRVDGRPLLWPSIVVSGAMILIAVFVWRNLEDAAASFDSEPARVAAADAVAEAASETAYTAIDETTRPVSTPKRAGERPGNSIRMERLAPLPPNARVLWATTWINVREQPGPEGAVVRVLNPGQKVLVVDPTRWWSVVYVDDERAGYVWVGALAEQPPG